MASPMSLREAVGIVLGREMVPLEYGAQAEALLDAAVEAHEALCERDDGGLKGGRNGHVHRRIDKHIKAVKKLRAMERGEEVE